MKTKAKWTYMVYLGGDNNLERFGVSDLMEMKRIGSSSEVHIIAQFDAMIDQVTRRFRITDKKSLNSDLEKSCIIPIPLGGGYRQRGDATTKNICAIICL